MSKIIKIPFNKGFNSQEDAMVVGEQPTKIENGHNLKYGVWTKRVPFSNATDISGKLFLDAEYYISPSDGTVYWIIYDKTSRKIYRLASNWGSPTELSAVAISPDRIEIKNWGTQMRFANGLANDPSIYQYIDRDFFHNGTDYFHSPTGAFHYDTKAYPEKPATWEYLPDTAGIAGTVEAGGTLTASRDYYYKIVPVFDGNQEAAFTDAKFGPLTTTSDNKSCKIKLKVAVNGTNWNPRITHCKIYRADTASAVPDSSEYSLIKTIDFTANAPSWINRSDGYTGRKIFANSLAADYSSFPATGRWNDDGNVYPNGSSTLGTRGTFTKASNNKFLFLGEDRAAADKWGDSGNTYFWSGTDTGVTSSTFAVTGGSNNRVVTLTKQAGFDNLRIRMESDVNYNHFGSGSAAHTFQISVFILRDVDSNGSYETTLYSNNPLGTYTYTGAGTGSTSLSGNDTIDVSALNDGESFQVKFAISASNDNPPCTSTISCDYQMAQFYAGSNTSIYSHQSMFAVNSSGVSDSTAIGNVVKVGGTSYTVTHNQGDIFRVSGNAGWYTGGSASSSGVTLSGMDVIYDRTAEDGDLSANETNLIFTDVGEVEGSYHPFAGTSSLNTKFIHSTSSNGRQFVGNVRLTSDTGETEDHGDMVLFSELNKPDVIPISNFIKLNDLQGGDIYGMSGLYSDVVIFAERGIFRLNIPQSDPTSWSLVESEKNIGCTQPYSICEYRGGVFFAGTDNIYYIDPNFRFIPISQNWKTTYQANLASTDYDDQTTIKVDQENQRLIVKAGTEGTRLRMLDLRVFPEENLWYEYKGTETLKHLTVLNDNKVWVIHHSGSDTKVQQIEGDGSATVAFSFKTGYISFTNIGSPKGVRIRRINYWYTQAATSSSVHTIKLEPNFTTDDVATNDTVYTYTATSNTAEQSRGHNHYSFYPKQRNRMRGCTIEFITPTFSTGATLKGLEIEID